MKPKEYVKEFNLTKDFINDNRMRSKVRYQLYDDFLDLINNVRMSPVTFKNIQEQLIKKIESIFTIIDLTDEELKKKFINFIYASVIIKERNRLYPDWSKACLDHKLATDKDFKRRYDNYIWRKEEEEWWDYYYGGFFSKTDKRTYDRLVMGIVSPNKEFEEKCLAFGFSNGEMINEESINKMYRLQSKRFHPDTQCATADPEKFNYATNLKDWLLEYIKNQSWSSYILEIDTSKGYRFEYVDSLL